MEFSFEDIKKANNANFQLENLNKSRFSINDSAHAMLIFIVLNILFSFLISGLNVSSLSGTIWYFGLQIAIELLFATTAFIVAKKGNLSFIEDTGMKNKVSLKMAGWCFLVSLVGILLFGNLTNVFLELLTYFGYNSVLGGIEISNVGQYLGYVIASCVSAAICEELLFRGVILSGFRKYGFKIAVFVSAFIFMIMHGNAEQTVHQFIVGVVVGIIFYKTGNLWIGVLIHFFNNLIPITQVFYFSVIDKTALVSEVTTDTVAIGLGTIVIDLIFAVLFAWLGFSILRWIFKKIETENLKLNGKYQTVGTKTAVVIDGTETTVDVAIDGVAVSNTEENVCSKDGGKQKDIIPMSTMVIFALTGLYLVGTWLMNTVYGFLI